jgi:hypothetical protein
VKALQDMPVATLELCAPPLTMAAEFVAYVRKDIWETLTSPKDAKVIQSILVILNMILFFFFFFWFKLLISYSNY